MNSVLKLRTDQLVWRKVEGELVLLDIKTSLYLAVNESGAHVWPLLVEGTTRDGLIEHLIGQYGLESTDATRDIDAFVTSMRKAGLLETDESD